MLRENTVFARRIIDFYSDKGVECSIVDEHSALLITLSADGGSNDFRYGRRAFAGARNWRKISRVLEREWANLRTDAAGLAQVAR